MEKLTKALRETASEILSEQLESIKDQKLTMCSLRTAEDQKSYEGFYEQDLMCIGEDETQTDYREYLMAIESYGDGQLVVTLRLDAFAHGMNSGRENWTEFHKMLKRTITKVFPTIGFKDSYKNLSSKPAIHIIPKDGTPWKKFQEAV